MSIGCGNETENCKVACNCTQIAFSPMYFIETNVFKHPCFQTGLGGQHFNQSELVISGLHLFKLYANSCLGTTVRFPILYTKRFIFVDICSNN